MTASQRALLHLYKHAGMSGVGCDDVGGAVWAERTGRVASSNGGGDYAAQMLLGRLKKAGLVEHAPSEGSSRWRLTPKGRREAEAIGPQKPSAPGAPSRAGARVGGTDPCTCGCAPEAHGGDPEYPGSTACTECPDCIAYEADPEGAA